MRRKSLEEFIEKAKTVHNNRYIYSKSVYKNSKTVLTVTCRIHGDFQQTPSNHVDHKKGCNKCSDITGSRKRKFNLLKEKDWSFKQPEDYKLIPLTKGMFTKVANEDFETLKRTSWTLSGNEKYVVNSSKGYLHRFIMEPTGNLVVDHINGDGLDNRRENLRICTSVQNTYNSKSNVNSTSDYKGVCIIKENKFMSQIRFEGLNKVLGYFTNEIEAAKAYDRKALELFGEFAYLNFPELKDEYLKQQ